MLGPDATVRLFGSRTEDDARGRDIDLLVESNQVIAQPALVSARLGACLQLALGDQRIDVVIAAPKVPEQSIHSIARYRGDAVTGSPGLAPGQISHILGTAASRARV